MISEEKFEELMKALSDLSEAWERSGEDLLASDVNSIARLRPLERILCAEELAAIINNVLEDELSNG